MSIITNDRDTAYRYAYTRCDMQNEFVIIYIRYVEGIPQYIATGLDSDIPTGATIEEALSPWRTPLYDYV